MRHLHTELTPGKAAPLAAVPLLAPETFALWLAHETQAGCRLASLFGHAAGDALRLFAVVAEDGRGLLKASSAEVRDGVFPSVTPACPQAHLFEREIAEQFGVTPQGHPWLKPVRFVRPLRDFGKGPEFTRQTPRVGEMEFFRVEGEAVHEVAVGPVHAGVIEPGHFRFQCRGETVLHLEISLGYQHRGVEAALQAGPLAQGLHLAETLAGDTTIGHGWAYCAVLEGLAGITPPPRALILRAVLLELERLANHTGDLGALAGDVGFLPTMSFCGRLRGDWLNLSALFCGSRFGRGLLLPGGVRFEADAALLAEARQRLEAIFTDTRGAVELLFAAPSVLARFEGTGTVSAQAARDLGLVGPAARACGLALDDRAHFAQAPYDRLAVPMALHETGDVYARARVRWLEIQNSVAFIRQALDLLEAEQGPLRAGPLPALAPDSLCVSLAEAWRGEVCHAALTGPDGRLVRYKVTDPSFHNWSGLALALRNQQISDFPLCNKSFNLSYCGFDL
jgi:Ni,Fe-hydrogenase III large subunit